MPDYEKISFNCSNENMTGLRQYIKQNPGLNQTTALNKLIADGLHAESKISEYKNLYEHATLKILFILRRIASAGRPDEFLSSIDADFSEELPTLKDMIKHQGMDYVGK